jgi:transketolase
MRQAFTKTLVELAEQDSRIVLLTGDLGFMALEPFSERFPNRFFNAGVAEQNMVGMATGLAEAGLIPFVYSIVTFATLRPYEFIRNGPILHQLPVRIVGMGGGFEYGSAGPSHHGLEDVGVFRIQPGITVIAPADSAQTASAMRATANLPGPVYYRLGKNDKISVPGLDGQFDLNRVQVVREGSDLLILSMGAVSPEAVSAADQLAAQGISCAVAVVSTLNPAPVDDLRALLSRYPLAITTEAHYVVGGLGSLVSEVVAEAGIACRVIRCGVRETPTGITGSTPYFYEQHGISAGQLVQTVQAALQQAHRR